MQVECSYCKLDLGEKEPLDDTRLSHSICNDCREYFMKQAMGLPLGEYLDQFEKPVLVLSGPEKHVLAANQMMADMLQKTNREMFGLLGGDVMECQYARLPAGCGETEHCPDCTIRNLVEKAVETDAEIIRQPAHLDQEGQRLHFLISVYPKRCPPEAIQVVIEEVVGMEKLD
jgi:hypothetical protein